VGRVDEGGKKGESHGINHGSVHGHQRGCDDYCISLIILGAIFVVIVLFLLVKLCDA
jgi:hypothetical protein